MFTTVRHVEGQHFHFENFEFHRDYFVADGVPMGHKITVKLNRRFTKEGFFIHASDTERVMFSMLAKALYERFTSPDYSLGDYNFSIAVPQSVKIKELVKLVRDTLIVEKLSYEAKQPN